MVKSFFECVIVDFEVDLDLGVVGVVEVIEGVEFFEW